jgi:hypothetical protein
MSAKPDAKLSTAPVTTIASAGNQDSKPIDQAPTVSAADKLRADLAQLDAERTALVKNTIENLKPGKPFDPMVVREINKIETRKNRLIVARFASLLRKNDPEVQAIVYQLIQL